ncbi:CDP-alcohol phosphatidyltransferase family protein [Smaragdicoccus niigatensis]|uniref:CDP-alcohol phosphatidyltransferase family protein n=1 Tax=Smaragdicoccus niigatensis TaxID=359359 RepID=UPI000363D210|nr:CDP-alcohol phosphatidyltransferase family protein [Smaragdicoccus niigatensis]
MPLLRPWVPIGLTTQLALLAVLAGFVHLNALGWLVGLASSAVIHIVLARALGRDGRTALGPANRVTLARAILAGGIAALVASRFTSDIPTALIVSLTVPALMLDAVDGRVARHTGSVSATGARFDGEVDAFLILVLSVEVSRTLGAWVLAIGAARYVLWAAEWVWPWLRKPVPPRYWRKVVAAVQGITLTVAMANVLPEVLNVVMIAGALVLLAESFGHDVIWLLRKRSERSNARL